LRLLTKELENAFAKIGGQEGVDDPIVVAHFFNPAGAGDWWATEYDPEEKMFFGYVSIFGDWNDEWGCFHLSELESIKGPFGLGIERDLHLQRWGGDVVEFCHLFFLPETSSILTFQFFWSAFFKPEFTDV
jgi:hypothetical protein